MRARAALLLVLAGCDRVLIGGEPADAGADLAPACQALGTIGFAGARTVGGVANPEGIAVADLDGDGRADLVVAANGDAKVSVFYGAGDGNFGDRHDLPTAAVSPVGVAVARFDQAAPPAVVVGTKNGLEVFPGAGGRAFGPSAKSPGLPVLPLALIELDGDGVPDVVAPVDDGTASYLKSWRGAVDGSLAPYDQVKVFTLDAFVTVGDFDRDGHDDVAMSQRFAGIDLLLANPTGGFFAPQRLMQTMAPVRPVGMAGADFDGDGHLDLAIADAQSATGAIKVLRGRGYGAFIDLAMSDAIGDAWDLAAGDLDCDGRPDLAVTSLGGSAVTVLRNVGQARFAVVTTLLTGAEPRHVLLADVTGDGKPDVVTSDNQSHQVSVLVNTSK